MAEATGHPTADKRSVITGATIADTCRPTCRIREPEYRFRAHALFNKKPKNEASSADLCVTLPSETTPGAAMKILKKLDIFVLKAYGLLFVGTFFICLFVLMMQFMWRYVEELIGKGLSTEILMKFFYYAGLTLIPMSLPLAVLLASLITFGNFGERLELLSMKAAGIPLIRILQPIFLFTVLLCIGSFYFQNVTSPQATKDLYTLVYSMKQKSPELEIPEGIFYNEIPGYNLYVEKKNKVTGMLYDVMIYTTTDGYEDAQIVLADSARLQTTADKRHLKLTLHNGERFRNMQTQGGAAAKVNVPYMRETFVKEIDLIQFDANFNMMDANLLSGNAATKDMHTISKGLDSLLHKSDSTGRALYAITNRSVTNRRLPSSLKGEDSVKVVTRPRVERIPLDTALAHMNPGQQRNVLRSAMNKSRSAANDYEYRALITEDMNKAIRLHQVEWHKKFTLSLACIIFFFIGAPLGAIIRKGGLGVPVVVSVAIFIFYYIVNVSGEKMAKSGEWIVWMGLWLSTAVLCPIGAFLTYKANKDSVAFNLEAYTAFFRKLLGLRVSRHINRKEVIITDPDYPRLMTELTRLRHDCRTYAQKNHLRSMPNYFRMYFRYAEDTEVIELNKRLESIVEELANSKDAAIIDTLNHLPVLSPDAHTRPFRNSRLNMAAGILFPIGLFFFFRVWRFRLRLSRDIQQIQKYTTFIHKRIHTLIDNK